MNLKEMLQPAIDSFVSQVISVFISIGIPSLLALAIIGLTIIAIKRIGPYMGEFIIMALIGVKDKFFDLFASIHKS